MNDTIKAALWTFAEAAGPVFIAGLFNVFEALIEAASKRTIPDWPVVIDLLIAVAVGTAAAGVAALKQRFAPASQQAKY